MANFEQFQRPTSEQRLSSFSVGVDDNFLNAFANMANSQNLESMFRKNRSDEFDLQRKQDLLPGELAKSNLERLVSLAKSRPDVIQTLLSGEMGKARQESAKGDFDQATLQSNITGSKADAQHKLIKQTSEMVHMAIPYLERFDPQSMEGQTAYRKVLSMMPPGVADTMPPVYDPTHMKRVQKFLVEADTKHQQKMAEIEKEGAYRKEIGAGHDAASRYASDARNRGHKKDMEQLVAEALLKGTDEQHMRLAAQADSDSWPGTEAQRQQAKRSGMAALRNIAAKSSLKHFDFGNPTAPFAQTYERMIRALQQQQKGPAGQTDSGPMPDPLGIRK